MTVAAYGTDTQVITAARGLVAAELHFNTFDVAVPSLCSDATLPVTPELRAVVPLVDPALTGSDKGNANSDASLNTPFDVSGLSVAEVMADQGFSLVGVATADAIPRVMFGLLENKGEEGGMDNTSLGFGKENKKLSLASDYYRGKDC